MSHRPELNSKNPLNETRDACLLGLRWFTNDDKHLRCTSNTMQCQIKHKILFFPEDWSEDTLQSHRVTSAPSLIIFRGNLELCNTFKLFRRIFNFLCGTDSSSGYRNLQFHKIYNQANSGI